MNTQETLERLVKDFEMKILMGDPTGLRDEQLIAYCLAVIARSLTR